MGIGLGGTTFGIGSGSVGFDDGDLSPFRSVFSPVEDLFALLGGDDEIRKLFGRDDDDDGDPLTTEQINQIYLDILGRPADPSGIASLSQFTDEGDARSAVANSLEARLSGASRFADQFFPSLPEFNPEPFGEVPLIEPSANFRELERNVVRALGVDRPLGQALRGDTNFQEAQNFFNQEVAPRIRSQFSGTGNFFSGAARSAEARALGEFLFNERDKAFSRAMEAASVLPGFANILDVDRKARAEQLANEIEVWAREQGFEAQAVQLALQAAGLRTEAILGLINDANIREELRIREEIGTQGEDMTALLTRAGASFLGSYVGGGIG